MDDERMRKVQQMLRSETTSICIATSDRDGRINVAPVGSAYAPDASTIGLLRAALAGTSANLQECPEAVFLLTDISPLRWLRFFLRGRFGAPFGYRVHARFREEKPLTESDRDRVLRGRFGCLANRKGGRMIALSLRATLLFDIVEIREVVPRFSASSR